MPDVSISPNCDIHAVDRGKVEGIINGPLQQSNNYEQLVSQLTLTPKCSKSKFSKYLLQFFSKVTTGFACSEGGSGSCGTDREEQNPGYGDVPRVPLSAYV